MDACGFAAGWCDTATSPSTVDAGSAMVTLPQTALSLPLLSIGSGKNFTVSSCADPACPAPWLRESFTAPAVPAATLVSNPYLLVEWASAADGAELAWGALWRASTTGRVFRLFTATLGSLGWADAAEQCRDLTVDNGGYALASVATAGELAAVLSLLNYRAVDSAWIGLTTARGGVRVECRCSVRRGGLGCVGQREPRCAYQRVRCSVQSRRAVGGHCRMHRKQAVHLLP